MTTQITAEVLDTVSTVHSQLNGTLESFGAPQIGNSESPYDRALKFVEFNQWLNSTSNTNLQSLATDYGLLPMVYSLSGLDIIDVVLLQNTQSIDLRGHIRYINIVLGILTDNDAETLADIGVDVFGSKFDSVGQTSRELRSRFISITLEHLINTASEITYNKSIEEYLSLFVYGLPFAYANGKQWG